MGVDELARSIARIERDRSSIDPPEESVRSILVALHHVHVPELSAAGLLAYDDATRTVTRTRIPDRFESIVERAVETGREVEAE